MLYDPRKLVLLLAAVVGWTKPALSQEFLANAAFAPDSVPGTDVAMNSPLYNYYSGIEQVGYQQALPPDPFAVERLHTPTPVRGAHFATGDMLTLNTRPDSPTMGIRLDTSFDLLRETSVHTSMSEHQVLAGGGATLLPFQSPGWLIGVRAIGLYADNQTATQDEPGMSADIFAGTRYKTVYMKAGAFWDYHDHFQKIGAAFSIMAGTGPLGVWTVDYAFGLGKGEPEFSLPRDPRFNIRQMRTEVADFDGQLRIGRFWTEKFQAGFTGNYLDFNGALNEWGAGAFANIYINRFRIGLDVTGGDEGLRGYMNVAFRWGASDEDRPRDGRLLPIDTVAWVTRAPDRDIALRIRESFTGPVRTFPTGVTGGTP